MKNTKKGFTLVELLVVIAILAILASVAVVGYTSFIKKANDSKAETELHQIVTTLNAEFMDDGKWGDFVRDELDADDADALETAINEYEDFDGLAEVTVTITAEGKVTLSYTVDDATVEADLD